MPFLFRIKGHSLLRIGLWGKPYLQNENMCKIKKKEKEMKSVFIIWIIVMTVSAIIGAFLWPYSINTWLIYFHKPPVFQWYYGAILGFIPGIGQLTIPIAVITWIAMMFLS